MADPKPLFKEHPLRESLAHELHARPFQPVTAPAQVSYLTVLSHEDGAKDDWQAVVAICEHFSAPPPAEHASHYIVSLGQMTLRWERHTEFSTYAFIKEGRFEQAFADTPIQAVPEEWLSAMPGQVVAAIQLAFTTQTDKRPVGQVAEEDFSGNTLIGAGLSGGSVESFADFRLHEDRFSRIMLRDRGANPRQAGRAVQRLLEMGAYRMMSLLALPMARAESPVLKEADQRIAAIAAQLTKADGASDQSLLDQLSRISADVEEVVAQSAYRFGAARAYYDIVQRRLVELRQERIQGLLTYTGFFERRLTPAMAYCESVRERQLALSNRAQRLTSLLRARVDVALEQQNRSLLESMDKRAKLQLRLQETVEGFSVVAISYYLTSLLGYGFKAMKDTGFEIKPGLATGLAAPLVVALVYFGIRRMKKAIHGTK